MLVKIYLVWGLFVLGAFGVLAATASPIQWGSMGGGSSGGRTSHGFSTSGWGFGK